MKYISRIISSLTQSHNREALYFLQSMSPVQLVEHGFSPSLVKGGLSAWPWREDNESSQVATIEHMIAEEQRCVNELQRYTDSELADLGLCRGSIRDCVRYGRPGVDTNTFRRAA